jgi:flavodoxin
MEIGIIAYSHTGNTLSVARKLEEALKAAGHSASIARVEPVNDEPGKSGFTELKAAPDVSPYDAVIFAAPVQAFSLARVMKQYLSQIADLSGKKVYCFVTQGLKKKWMGGNHAVHQIKSACKAKGADVVASGIVNWSGSTRDKQIEDIVKRLGAIQ